ncbi:peptidoglycan-binding protein [Streptomyces sp. NPDC021020]|uniref:peptidoglycan-binding protein n=1 Tax=Streptomyces sp. NPDC021020 TaxID=3365109 RepID=UPI0037B19758
MPSTSFRRRVLARAAVPLTAAVMATGVAAVMATPAAASNSYNGNAYISGTGNPYDDFNDEGALNTSTNAVSNATCLWQSILVADGYLDNTVYEIDGSFGAKTRDATESWQSNHGLDDDGSVGKLTFKKVAEIGLIVKSQNDDGSATAVYDGWAMTLQLKRATNGRWSFLNERNDKWYTASYNTRTCPNP